MYKVNILFRSFRFPYGFYRLEKCVEPFQNELNHFTSFYITLNFLNHFTTIRTETAKVTSLKNMSNDFTFSGMILSLVE